MALVEGEVCSGSVKRMYEWILSAKEPSDQLGQTVALLIKGSVSSAEHLGFLLHRISWFQPPFCHYQQSLLKLLRLYRSLRPSSCRVVYNMVLQNFLHQRTSASALACLKSMFREGFDRRGLLAALTENYPHKLCPIDMHSLYLGNLIELCREFKGFRADFLEIVVENLAKIDTEVVGGDEWVHKPFPSDLQICELREKIGSKELAVKLDSLLGQMLSYLSELQGDEAILDQMLLVFQSRVLPIKTTKNIQLLSFFVAEGAKGRSARFIGFLLGSIFDNPHRQNWYRVFSQSNFYLFSYIRRSKTVTPGVAAKALRVLMEKLRDRVKLIEEGEVDEKADLRLILQSREVELTILQTVVMMKLDNEQLDREDLNFAYESLLAECRKRLHYEYFFREEILERMGVDVHKRNSLRLKFSNKFLPSTLPGTGARVDSLMVMRELQGEKKEREEKEQREEKVRRRESMESIEMGKKRHKGETPISYCSETVF